MKHRIYIIAALLAVATAGSAQSFRNFQVSAAGEKTVVSLDVILDSLQVPSNRYRAFTPIIISKDGTQQQRLKSLLVTGRTQEIVFEREGIDPLYAGHCDQMRRYNGTVQSYS